LERSDGVPGPVLVPGNPVKLSKVDEPTEDRVPWVGEHTDDVLRQELELTDDDLAKLRDAGALGPGQDRSTED
jgi:crotonobetainyl-CoA:carnitine CoA-transferase CaiB-like acyl-CoA transferase